MLIIGAAILGAILGALNARRRGGKPADMAQYAAASAIIFALIGFAGTILLARMGGG